MHFESHRQHRPINLLATPRNKNNLVLAALGVWFVLAIAMFAWFGVRNNQFSRELQQSKASVSGVLFAAPAKFQAVKAAGDVAATVAALRELSATVSQNAQSLPQAPSLFGVHIGADVERRDREQLKAAAEAYAARLTEVADFIAYQSAASRELQGLSLKDAAGYDQTIALAGAWRDAAKKMQNDSKPVRLNEVTATLVQKMSAAEIIIREMAELYKKADTNGFKAKQAQLAAVIAEFKTISTQISTLSTQLDAELASSHAKLRQNL